jgi:hypothetical protein
MSGVLLSEALGQMLLTCLMPKYLVKIACHKLYEILVPQLLP